MVEAIILKLGEMAETSAVGIGLSLGFKMTTANLCIIRTLNGSNEVKAILQVKSCLLL